MLLGDYLYSLSVEPHEHPEDFVDSLELKERAKQWIRREAHPEEVFIHAEDGKRLYGRFLIPPQGAGRSPYDSGHVWAVCLHGINSDGSFAGPYAHHYFGLGCRVLFPDLRGFGKTGGGYVGYGVKDHRDLICWTRWILGRDPEAEIILHGESMGAATVLLASGAGDLPVNVAAAIADSSYSSIEEEFSDMFRRMTAPWMPAAPFITLLRRTVRKKAGYDIREGDVLSAVSRSTVPVMFLHGLADTCTDYHMSLRMYDAARNRKDIELFEGMDHVKAVGLLPEQYWNAVHRFLDPVMERNRDRRQF